MVDEADARRVQMSVAEPARQHAAHGRRAVAQHAAEVGVARVGRVVGRVHAIELIAAHAQVLVQQAAPLAAGERETPGNAERQIALRAQHRGVGRLADRLQLERRAHEAGAGTVCKTVKDLPATKRSLAKRRNS